MQLVRPGQFPITPDEFLEGYAQSNSLRTSVGFTSVSVTSASDNVSANTDVDGSMIRALGMSKFSQSMLHSDETDFVVGIMELTDESLYDILSSVVSDFEEKFSGLVGILEELRNMMFFFLTKKDKKMKEAQFQPIVKHLMTYILNVLDPHSTNSVVACQRNARLALSKKITVNDTAETKKATSAILRGESDLALVGRDKVRYFELKPVGGALFRSNAWQAKDQALAQTVCSSTANDKSVVAIGGLLDLFTVYMIVTSPVEEVTRNVVSQISKRVTDSRSWMLLMGLLLVVPTDSITKLIPLFSDDLILPVLSDDAVVEKVAVGGLDLTTPARTTNHRGSSISSSSGPPISSQQTEDAATCRWIAREALRDRNEEKVRTILEADARSDGFSYLCKENLEKINQCATTVRPHGDRGRTFGVLL
jgi:hypothetical protein